MGQVNEAGDLLAASVWPHHLVSTIKSGGKESWIYFSYRNLQPYEYSSINQVGYVLRMDQACIPKVVQRLTLDKRKSGRLKTTWSRTVMAELSEVALARSEAQHAAKNEAKWREIVITLCPTRDENERVSKWIIRRDLVISSTQCVGTGLPTAVC